MGASRVWCLVFASLVFTIAQLFAINLTNPRLLATVSGFSGLGYGLLFGVFPSIVAETFGIHGLSQNWGFMTLAPAVSGNIFNLIYGSVFDKHTIVDDDGNRSCPDGLDCYKDAYYVTLGACALGLLTTLYTIRHQYVKRQQEDAKVIAVD
jgi:MFS family permease